MKKNWKSMIAALLSGIFIAVSLAGCGNSPDAGDGEVAAETEVNQEEQETEPAEADTAIDQAEEAEETAEAAEADTVVSGPKEVIIYFANWDIHSKGAAGEVASIPWDNITYINHAFWAVTPDDGTEDSSFDWRDGSNEPRTAFKIESTDAEADYLDESASSADSSLPKNHFAQYEHFSQQYPDVNILIALGGWTRCGYFSEMAYTEAGRESFINSCLELLEQYPWIDGIDIDWEYQGGNLDGERRPEGPDDEGCPIWGTAAEDNANFALLAQGLREAMDAAYGAGTKKLTACASSSYGYTLPCQDWAAAEPYLDYINVMTYDLAGTWAGMTGHNSGMPDTRSAISFLLGKSIPAAKLNIGSPMYGMDLKMTSVASDAIVGAPIEATRPSTVEIDQTLIREWKDQAVSGYTVKEENGKMVLDSEFANDGTGWHFAFDDVAKAPYLYNDDESSPYYGWYVSFEDELSLQAKIDFIQKTNLGGIIVWECGQDTAERQMITQMGESLITP